MKPVHTNETLRSELVRMSAERDALLEAQQWQPIETAPKDGTVVMVCNEDGTWIAKYVPIYPSGCRAENPWFSLMLNHDHLRKVRSYRPTHWMPLPAPPSTPQWRSSHDHSDARASGDSL